VLYAARRFFVRPSLMQRRALLPPGPGVRPRQQQRIDGLPDGKCRRQFFRLRMQRAALAEEGNSPNAWSEMPPLPTLSSSIWRLDW